MKGREYIFDAAQGIFRKSVTGFGTIVLKVLKYGISASALAVLWYAIFAFVINTDVERRLKGENRVYEREYQAFKEDVELLESVVTGLELRDAAIYDGLFHNSVQAVRDNGFQGLAEDISEADVYKFTTDKLESALDKAARVDAAFRSIFEAVDTGAVLPPLGAPVKEFSVQRVGATVGTRISPFIGAATMHEGLDIIGASGTSVVAAADGVVGSVVRSLKGKGNEVVIMHEGGYSTHYCNLGSIGVLPGKKVQRGEVIGTIGMSGVSYAPHLHYEVHRGSQVLDPSQYLFARLSPDEYIELQAVAQGTGQTLD